MQTTEDTFDESGETFTVTISSPSGGGGPAPSLDSSNTSVTTTIDDDDEAISGITLTVSPTSVGEDDAKTEFTVTASLGGTTTRSSETVVTLTLGGTAGSSDYTVNTSLTSITIPANTTSATGTLELTPTDDTVVEGDETIIISGTTTTAVGLSVSSATITLNDHNETTTGDPNDKDSAELSIAGPTSDVDEGSDATFTVTLSAAVSKEVTVTWTATDNTSDYSPTSGTVTFAANSAADASQSITIAVTDDALSEGAESFTVTLGTVGGDLSSQVSVDTSANSDTATIVESDPITVSISGPTSVDEGEVATYTVSISGGAPTADLTVSYATADGTGEFGATAGEDYTATSDTLTFSSGGMGEQTVSVQTTQELLIEPDETFTITISSPSGGGGGTPTITGNATVTTTISTDDASSDPPGNQQELRDSVDIWLTVDPESVNEGAGSTSFTVTAEHNGDPQSDPVTIQLALAGTATMGSSGDYTAPVQASVTIPANQTSGTATLTLDILSDDETEGDETIIVGGSYGELVIRSAVITIHDDEATYLSITGPADVTEGSNASFTVTLSKTVAADVTVAWSAVAGTAVAADLGSSSGSVIFPANSGAGATQTITIPVTDDSLSEGPETFSVELGDDTGTEAATVWVKSTANSDTATIAESDPITVSIAGPSSVNEGDTTSNYTVSLAGGTLTADLTVSYGTADGTATAGSDYTAKSGTLTFTPTAAGGQTFTVVTAEDEIDEDTGETFTVSISSPSGGGGPAPGLGTSSVSTTIADDDTASVTLSVSPSSVREDDKATNITVTATLDEGMTRASGTVVTIGTLSGTATKDTDYSVTTALGSITIPPGAANAIGTLTLDPTDDDLVEGDETIVIPGTVAGVDVSSATVTLTDDATSQQKDSAKLSISGPASKNVSEGSDATFTVTLSKAVAAEVEVAWSAPLPADAAEGADLSATSGTVTFPANSAEGATQTITITATDDALSEGDESFTVTLGTITSTLAQVSVDTSAGSDTATIAASDPITVSITGPSTVEEGDATSDYTVSLSGGTPTADLTVSYATADGTATSGDYTATSDTLTFTATDLADKTFTVQTTEDKIDEPDEAFTVTISSLTGGGGPASIGTLPVTTTIADDDDAPSDITLSASSSTLGEDDAATSVTVTATLNGGTTRSSATVVTIGTLEGTATKDTDYTATSLASITIPANSSTGTGSLTITPTDDTVVEGDETIKITGTTTPQVGLDVSPVEITLTDDDKSTSDPGEEDDKDSAELTITGPTSNVSEGGDAVFTVALSHQVNAEVIVSWSAPLGTDAAEGADLSATSGTVTFPANSTAGATQSITITATDDTLSELAESFTVTLKTITSTLSSHVSLKSGASSATATIVESDPITVNISGPASVDEGDATSNYTVSLSGGTPTADLTVSYGTADGTATSGSDYTATSDTLTFTPTAAGPQTFTVSTTEDSIDEGTGETFTVTISSPSGGGGPAPSVGTSSVSTTITDDDAPISTGPTNPPLAPRPPPSPTPTPEATPTPTPTPEATPTPTPTPEATPTPTSTPEATPIPTPTPEATPTPTATPEATPISTSEVTPTPTSTPEATSTPTPTPTPTPKATPVPAPRTGTGPARGRLTPTPTATPEATLTPTPTPTPGLVRETLPGLGSGMGNGSANGTTSTPVPGTTPVPKLATLSMLTTETTSRSSWDSNGAVKSNGTGHPTPTASPEQSMLPSSGLSLLPWWIILLIAVLIAIAIRVTRRLLRRKGATSGLLPDRTS